MLFAPTCPVQKKGPMDSKALFVAASLTAMTIMTRALKKSDILILRRHQGCQIFLDTIYQNKGKYTTLPQHDPIAINYTK
jgi:hypothetical protein